MYHLQGGLQESQSLDMGAAYMSQHYERTVETAVLGATYVGNSYLANTF